MRFCQRGSFEILIKNTQILALTSTYIHVYPFLVGKLMDLHGEGSGHSKGGTGGEGGEKVDRPEGYEPPVMESV